MEPGEVPCHGRNVHRCQRCSFAELMKASTTFNHQSNGLICTRGKKPWRKKSSPRGVCLFLQQSHAIPWVFTWFSSNKKRMPRLLQGARPQQKMRTETGSLLVAGAGTLPPGDRRGVVKVGASKNPRVSDPPPIKSH